MDMMISNLQQQRQVTEQLRREAAIKRISVSQAVADIMKFISDHEQEDCLVVGFSSEKANPFREKSSCILL
ncbi:guanine nucleotide-binding protein subunit gamma-1 [Frankliniella occidentalis]|uniref:Guanine nucleotide-binding protein subunit gamma-1 n=1 Tax=Frankliniella occidentalis TaxID=133901 RepID=A0A6J1SFF2_FRAOC|nr:guanine nucleotide-binding protein subunit gamma-1 [Frankliniella occidentalis]